MFDAQAWYARDVILGRIQLPTKEVMTQEEKEWLEKEDGLEEDSDYIWFQGDYVKKLISETDCPYLDTDGVNKAFEEWISHKDADILTYRDKAFKSLVTGTMACTHPVPWVDMQDDSLQAYIEAASSAKMSQDANSTDENENSV
jgi:trimethylamine monooxygenase